MKIYSKYLLFLGTVFFCLGIAWGIWTDRKNARQLARAAPLRILCAEKWLSDNVLQKFSLDHHVRIQQWTYATPSEFVRQMANSEGKVDVICTSSLLVKSLERSHWLKKMNFQSLSNLKLLAVDFARLPYDPEFDYSVPLFWNLYGFFGKHEAPSSSTWKQTLHDHKVSLWGDELNVLQILGRFGVKMEEHLEEEEGKAQKAFQEELKHFTQSLAHVLKPGSAAATAEVLVAGADWVELPVARVAQWLGSGSLYHFWLPDDGATLDVGVLGVGENATQPELAMSLINELLTTEAALETHQHVGGGVVHASLSNLNTILPFEKPQALRQFPLNRLQFPDLSVEVLPHFQKIYDETLARR